MILLILYEGVIPDVSWILQILVGLRSALDDIKVIEEK